MAKCDVCGKQVDMPYQCRHCGGTYCSDHRLPENHDCPGLTDWGDPSGVFDSGFDDDVTASSGTGSTGGLTDRLTATGGTLGYFRGNMTFVFLGLMWITFGLQFAVRFLLEPTGSLGMTLRSLLTYRSIFVLTAAHPEYVWTWFTSIFAHGGIYHIAINSIVIYFFGRLVEQYVGSKEFTALFLASGAIAGLSQIGIHILQEGVSTGPLAPGVVGASGAGLAIMGVLTVLNPSLRVYLYFILPIPIWVLTIGYAAFSVLAILGSGAGAGGIAQMAHLTGLVIGLVYGQHVKRRGVTAPRRLQFGGGPGGPGGRRRGPF